jgi:hypothetical protein
MTAEEILDFNSRPFIVDGNFIINSHSGEPVIRVPDPEKADKVVDLLNDTYVRGAQDFLDLQAASVDIVADQLANELDLEIEEE